jgi:hypothetical protein
MAVKAGLAGMVRLKGHIQRQGGESLTILRTSTARVTMQRFFPAV